MSSVPSTSQIVKIYSSGTKAWLESEEEAWISGTCTYSGVADGKIRLTFNNDRDKKEYVFEYRTSDIEIYGESILPPLRNPPKIEHTDDLTNLSYLNEPSVLNTIRTRYENHFIYTYSGIVLIAVNPFDRVSLYGPETVQKYSGKRRSDLDPHLFAIAEDAYRCMIREKSNQTVVVSGESGAGKTVSAKYIMRYFAMANDAGPSEGERKTHSAMTEVEKKILATNPIMEAFGNAKTTRNDNSSRFGKYIEIQFDRDVRIIGARFKTYLLERSRLIFQADTERNYHIFYQLCAGMPLKEKELLGIGNYRDYKYLIQGGSGELDGVNDAEEFASTKSALSTVGLSEELQSNIFRLLAALLHIGNIKIDGRNDAILPEGDSTLSKAAELLGIDEINFRKWIVQKQITTNTERITTNLSPQQAHVVKDSVAKFIYSNLFEWLVVIINERLACFEDKRVTNFIGVLDIYGFEHFESNSFEQFCINYANEKLQQQFNKHVFKLEQEEYEREEIDWTFIKFTDNQECIELIEGKMGILSILDENSRLPGATDKGFLQKLYSDFDKPAYNQYFKKPRFPHDSFVITHYAHDVEYEVDNFLDKNKDAVPDEHLSLLKKTEFSFLREVLEKTGQLKSLSTARNKRLSMIARKPTLGSIFKNSLISLMATIEETNVHYIRCIKPNQAKTAWKFEPPMVLAQLRACGVLETIRISCAGYPSRWTFREFCDRYYILVNSSRWKVQTEAETRSLCSVILDLNLKDNYQYQVGLTKIFFRAGQLAYLEKLRSIKFNDSATVLQKNARRFICRLRYTRILDLVLRLQCVARRKVAGGKRIQLERNMAALKIQTRWRRHTARKAFLGKRQFIIALQTVIRSHRAQKLFKSIHESAAALKIQRTFRGWRVRKSYNTFRARIVLIQSLIRRRAARKHFYDLKAEARSVKHLQGKMVELQETVKILEKSSTNKNVEADELRQQIRTIEDEKKKSDKAAKLLESRLATIEKEYRDLEIELTKKTALLKTQEATIVELQKSKESLQTALTDQAAPPVQAVIPTGDPADKVVISRLESEIEALKEQLSKASNDSVGKETGTSAQNMPHHNADPKIHDSQFGKLRRNSSPDLHSIETRFPSGYLDTALCNPRPTSATSFDVLFGNVLNTDVAKEIDNILRDEDAVIGEILSGLINAKIPQDSEIPLREEQIFFPAHMINICMTQLWQRGYIQDSEHLLLSVRDAIERRCQKSMGMSALIPCAFWLSNVHELYSLICLEECKLTWVNHDGVASTLGSIKKCKNELGDLEAALFYLWVKELKVVLELIIVPAVIDGQSLAVFKTEDRIRSNEKLFTGSTSYEVDDLLSHLSKIWLVATTYRVDQKVKTDLITELLRMIGVTAFNELLERPKFASWKRALQIEYNIKKIDYWCTEYNVSDGFLQLQHLAEATRILQRKKSTWDDIDNIFESCTDLSPNQILRLLSHYCAAGYEGEVDIASCKLIAAERSQKSGASDILLLEPVSLDHTAKSFELPAAKDTVPVTYLPAWLNLKRLRRLANLTQFQRDQQRAIDNE